MTRSEESGGGPTREQWIATGALGAAVIWLGTGGLVFPDDPTAGTVGIVLGLAFLAGAAYYTDFSGGAAA